MYVEFNRITLLLMRYPQGQRNHLQYIVTLILQSLLKEKERKGIFFGFPRYLFKEVSQQNHPLKSPLIF